MSKYVVLHDREDKPVYLNPELVIAVYYSPKRNHTSVYTVLGAEVPFYVKETPEEARNIIWNNDTFSK